MNLIELLRSVAEWNDDDTTIFVTQPWSCEAAAILVTPAPEAAEPIQQDATSYDYFIETFIAREFLEGFAASEEGASATERHRCERLIRYAQDDA